MIIHGDADDEAVVNGTNSADDDDDDCAPKRRNRRSLIFKDDFKVSPASGINDKESNENEINEKSNSTNASRRSRVFSSDDESPTQGPFPRTGSRMSIKDRTSSFEVLSEKPKEENNVFSTLRSSSAQILNSTKHEENSYEKSSPPTATTQNNSEENEVKKKKEKLNNRNSFRLSRTFSSDDESNSPFTRTGSRMSVKDRTSSFEVLDDQSKNKRDAFSIQKSHSVAAPSSNSIDHNKINDSIPSKPSPPNDTTQKQSNESKVKIGEKTNEVTSPRTSRTFSSDDESSSPFERTGSRMSVKDRMSSFQKLDSESKDKRKQFSIQKSHSVATSSSHSIERNKINDGIPFKPPLPPTTTQIQSSEDELNDKENRLNDKKTWRRSVTFSSDDESISPFTRSGSRMSVQERLSRFDQPKEKRNAFGVQKAYSMAAADSMKHRRQVFSRQRSTSSENENPSPLRRLDNHPEWAYRKESSTSQSESDEPKSALLLKAKWENRTMEETIILNKTKAFGGLTGAAAMKEQFENQSSNIYNRRSSSGSERRKSMNLVEVEAVDQARRQSAASIKAKFEAQNKDQIEPPKRNFVINKDKTAGVAKKFSTLNVSNKCAVCGKTVYPMEKLEANGVVYHKSCFRCCICNRTLGLGNYAALQGKIYCKPHLKQLFKLKGNYDEGFGRVQRKADWVTQDPNAKSSNPSAESGEQREQEDDNKKNDQKSEPVENETITNGHVDESKDEKEEDSKDVAVDEVVVNGHGNETSNDVNEQSDDDN